MKTLWALCFSAVCAVTNAHGTNLFQLATRGVDVNSLPDKAQSQQPARQHDLVITYSYKKASDGKYIADKISSISNLSEVVQGCTNHYIDGRIDQVSFNSLRMPEIISVSNGKNKEVEVFDLNDLFGRLAMADHDYVRSFFRRDARVVLTYQRCGASGRVVEMRDIFSK